MTTPSSAARAAGVASSHSSQREPYHDTLKRFALQAGSVAEGRFDLFKIELVEERERLGHLLTRGLFAAFLASLTMQLVAGLAIALAWDTPWRIPVIVGLAVASLVATVLMARAYRQMPKSRLFEASIHEFAKDVHTMDRQP